MRSFRRSIQRLVLRNKQCILHCAGGRIVRIPAGSVAKVRVCSQEQKPFVRFDQGKRVPYIHASERHVLSCWATHHQ
ncbi:MAG: hypothetical protein HZC01_00585 [Candidatus Kerfeldbacteria bacterium]|nr:hypothetical protein [Candidatus Kerfeldbacteria bacterium]